VDFTREPIIETVITPREGCKIVVRSSKSVGQEEYFVDAVEVVSFGNSFFFRSLERPKAFLVPVTDYEILEVRETRMVLKSVGLDRSIKIGGGKEQAPKSYKEPAAEKMIESTSDESAESKTEEPSVAAKGETRLDKKRDRRRHYRRKRGREEGKEEQTFDEKEEGAEGEIKKEEKKIDLIAPLDLGEEIEGLPVQPAGSPTTSLFSSLLAPPPTLISETIALYKENELFKNVFFTPKKDLKEEQEGESSEGEEKIPLELPLTSQDSDSQAFREEENEFDKDPFRDLEQLEIAFPPLEEGMVEELGLYEEEIEIETPEEETPEEEKIPEEASHEPEEVNHEETTESCEPESLPEAVEEEQEDEHAEEHSENNHHFNSSASNDSQA
jgi:hypothetical protein